MHGNLINAAVIGYVVATGLALAYLVQRQDLVHRLAVLATLAGWAAHSVVLIARAIELGAPPLGSLPDAISVAVWVIVLVEVLIERRTGLRVLGAFVLPIVVVLSLKAATPRAVTLAPALASVWIWIHIALALIGIAAFVFNFAGALMYLLQEHQLKAKRPGAFYYRLPALETLDHLTFRTLALGFPFLTTGLLLGALWARTAWGSAFTFDPLAFLSVLAWLIYAGTLAGRAAGGWHGRRAAYFSIIGFAILVLTLGAGLFLPGRHGAS
jgi:cytochrome c-type biogenesis protein CcsB